MCRRPAVSAISTSMPRERAVCSASKITLAESAPGLARSPAPGCARPRSCSCSTAAARKVSPAASITARRSSRQRRASLPMVVVLPTPLTPTISTTNGCLPRDVERLLDRLQQRDQLLAQRGEQRVGIGELALVHALAQVLDQLGAGLDADVGGDQGGFELVEQGVVEHGVAREQRAEAAREAAAGKALAPAAFGAAASAADCAARWPAPRSVRRRAGVSAGAAISASASCSARAPLSGATASAGARAAALLRRPFGGLFLPELEHCGAIQRQWAAC